MPLSIFRISKTAVFLKGTPPPEHWPTLRELWTSLLSTPLDVIVHGAIDGVLIYVLIVSMVIGVMALVIKLTK